MGNGTIEAKGIDLFAVRASIREVIVHDIQELMVFVMIEAKALVMIASKDRVIMKALVMIAPKDRVIMKALVMIAPKDRVIIEVTLNEGITEVKTGTLVERTRGIYDAKGQAVNVMMLRVNVTMIRVIPHDTDALLPLILREPQ